MQDRQLAAMARALASLGHEARLTLYRRLVRAGLPGMNAGALARDLGLAPSTLAHHLAALAEAGLVVQERRGRETISRADYSSMHALIDYLTRECCADERAAGPT